MQQVYSLETIQELIGHIKWEDFLCPKCGGSGYELIENGIRCNNRQCIGERPRLSFTAGTAFGKNKANGIDIEVGLQLLIDIQYHFKENNERPTYQELAISRHGAYHLTANGVYCYIKKVVKFLPDELKEERIQIPKSWFIKKENKQIAVALFNLLFDSWGLRPAAEILHILITKTYTDDFFKLRVPITQDDDDNAAEYLNRKRK